MCRWVIQVAKHGEWSGPAFHGESLEWVCKLLLLNRWLYIKRAKVRTIQRWKSIANSTRPVAISSWPSQKTHGFQHWSMFPAIGHIRCVFFLNISSFLGGKIVKSSSFKKVITCILYDVHKTCKTLGDHISFGRWADKMFSKDGGSCRCKVV